MNRAKKAEPARFPEFQAAFNELMGDMTIKEFADKLGMSRATVGFYSAGQRIPDALGIKAIVEKCGVSADWLLGLSNVQSRDGETRQVCSYTGLSQAAVEHLHQIGVGKRSNLSAVITFLDFLFDEKYIMDFSFLMRRAAMAKSIFVKNVRSGLSCGNEFETIIDSQLSEQFYTAGKQKEPIKVSAEELSELYSFRAVSCLEEVLDDAIMAIAGDSWHYFCTDSKT